jgi:hypothetical protein
MIEPHDILRHKIKWNRTAEPERPFEATIDGHHLALQVNDFPASQLYTLLVDDAPALSFDEWLEAWLRPAA